MGGDCLDRDEDRCSPETLRRWIRQAERDRGLRPGVNTQERERIKALEREVRELRQADEINRADLAGRPLRLVIPAEAGTRSSEG